MPMTDARRPMPTIDERLDAALARTVRRAPRADLRARVLARVGQGRPVWVRPVPTWTALAAAVLLVFILARALRETPAEMPHSPAVAQAPPSAPATTLRAPTTHRLAAMTDPSTARVGRRTDPRRAAAAVVMAVEDGLPEEALALPPLQALALMHLQPMENAHVPLAPLHDERLAIAPLEGPQDGLPGQEDMP
jgi:hypothetical protein